MKQRPFCDQRPSMAKNPLLQRPKIGRTIKSTHDLPDEDFRYGKVYHDDFGVKECLTQWQQINRLPTARKSSRKKNSFTAKQDFIATNKAALKAGCVSAKEYREFKLKNEIFVKPEENFSAEEDAYNKVLRRSMTHGIATPVSSEMKDCLTYKFGRDAVEFARKKQEIRHRPKTAIVVSRSNHVTLPTRATIGESVKPEVPPSYADTFKMKRFLAIDHYAIKDYW